MTVFQPRDPADDPIACVDLAFPMGALAGGLSVNKFGENHNIATNSTETVWEGSNLYPFPATAAITHASMKVDQVAMRGETVEVRGLDANWAMTHQDVVLDATDTTTAVALATPLRRVYRAFVKGSVVTDQILTIHNAADTVDYAYITAGENQTTMAVYTVPAGYTAFVTSYYAYHHPATGQSPTSLDIKLYGQDNDSGYAPQLKHTVGIPSDGNFHHYFGPYYKFTEKSDIYVNVTTTGAAVHVSAGFDLVLVPNTMLV